MYVTNEACAPNEPAETAAMTAIAAIEGLKFAILPLPTIGQTARSNYRAIQKN
jgi:hypothetical protein